MNRREIAHVLVLIVSLVALTQAINLASAQYLAPPSIEISSPIPSPMFYQKTSVPLYVTVNILTGEPKITYASYTLDGQATVILSNLTREDNVAYWTSTKGVFEHGTAFHAKASLDNLAEGKHTLVVCSHAADGKEMSQTREFTVDYNYVPPQSTSSGHTNHTATPAPTDSQTETSIPTINTGSIQPSETPNLIPLMVTGAVVASALATVLYFKRKNKGNRTSR
jgi:hypothetical protein